MKISIVTISFNQAPFLRQCIDSILSQSGVDVEYIVVDPGSTDGSREMIESYGDRIIKVFEPDAGPADGLNHGFTRATGDVFGFINSDDYLLPGALATVVTHFERSGLDEFVSGSGWIEYGDGRRCNVIPTMMQLDPYLYGACTVFQQGTFFPAKIFREVGGFNNKNRTCWDGELFARFLAAGHKHKLINTSLAVFRLYEGSISGSQRQLNDYLIERKRIFNEIKQRKPSTIDTPIGWWWRARKIIHRHMVRRASRAL